MAQNSIELFRQFRENEEFIQLNKPIIIADGLRTPENMGSVLRLAANIGAEKTIIISDKAAQFKNYKINKTASGAASKTAWKIIEHYTDLEKEIPDGYKLIALETTPDAENIYSCTFPSKLALVIGNEVSGISDELLSQCTSKLYIPIPGPISSLNVTHALSAALFEWMRQQLYSGK